MQSTRRVKKTRLVILFLMITVIAFAQSDNKEKFRDNAEYFMKFRGSVSMTIAYYFGVLDGLTNTPHFSLPSYTLLDYRDHGDSDNDHHSNGLKGRIIGSKAGEPKLNFSVVYDFIAPFLNFKNPLFKGNNIKLSFYGDINPISMFAGGGITFTPIAFLNFHAGFFFGTAWNVPGLLPGLGRNIDGNILRENFYGPVMRSWFSSTFQFDIAAVMPKNIKRWTHIVMQATPKIHYQALLNIPENIPYIFLTDRGENLNGWHFKGSFLLGYQIPVIEDDFGKDRQFIKIAHKNFKITTAMYFLIDDLHLSHYYDSLMANNGWGSDFTYVDFGPLLKFDLPYNFFCTLILFWANDKKFSDGTVGNLYYQDREYEDWYVYLRRFVFQFGYNF